uniref:Secreted protein n=1 Tax=Parascaris univalens TaxID=6257 RepID=A0A915CFF3_PARUN
MAGCCILEVRFVATFICSYSKQYEKNFNTDDRHPIMTFQNCGTGSCVKRGGRPTCVCSRCGSGGGSWPSV